MEETVILVDEQDREIGTEEKIETHRKGTLHRSFSIFILNSKGEMLLQQRAKGKYHSGGLWSNACCGHPRPGEATGQAARRRLKEEMGFDCELKEIFQFIYKVELDHDLWEHEFDHVYKGMFNGEMVLNPQEVMNFRWIDKESLQRDVREHPEKYSAWFKIALEKVLKELEKAP
ncbi:MAG: isopentenyl-diphosphate Delta-isomerase [Patescibacteria group bacterium]